jgi:ABC-type phosphate/phosphonate transport system permease subunit
MIGFDLEREIIKRNILLIIIICITFIFPWIYYQISQSEQFLMWASRIANVLIPVAPLYYVLRKEYERTKEALKMKKEKYPDKLKIVILIATGNNAYAFANKCLQFIAQSQDEDIKNNEQLRNELQEVFKF